MITIVKEDPLVGIDEDLNLYDGERVEVSYDELDVQTIETEDGYERITTYEGEIISKGTINKESWKESAQSLRSSENQASDEELEELWQKELSLANHGKIWSPAYVDGEMTMIEIKLKRIKWVAR